MKKQSGKTNKNGYGELTHQTFRGLNWQFFGKGVQFFLRVLVLAVLARLLVPKDFGLVAAAIVVVNFSTIFSRIGIGPALVQRPEIDERHSRTAFTLSVLFGVFLSIVVFLAAPLVENFFAMEGLKEVLQVITIIFILRGISTVPLALLQRDLNFRMITLAEIISFGLGYGLVGIILAFQGFGVWALVGANLSQALLKVIVLFYIIKFPKKPQLNISASRELLFYGSGFTFSQFFNFLAREGDNFVVGRWLGAELLGFYDRAYQLMKMPASLFGQILETVLFSAMAKIQDEHKRLARVYLRGTALTALISLPITAIFIFLASEIVQVVLGDGWEQVIIPFQILAIGTLFRTSYKIGDSVSKATGAVYQRAWRQFLYAFFVVFGAWVGSSWDLPGVAVGVLFAIILNYFLMAQLSISLSKTNFAEYAKCHIPALLLTVVFVIELGIIKLVTEIYSFSPLFTLFGAGVIIGLTTVGLLFFAPKKFFGEEGLWMVGLLLEYLSVFKKRRKK